MTDENHWAVVELMGHRTRAGAIMWTQIDEAHQMLVVEHPTRSDHTGEEPLTETYGAGAIYSIRRCSREEAEKVAKDKWADPADDPWAEPI